MPYNCINSVVMEKKYYYADASHNQIGPVDLAELRAAGITRTTYVWREGLDTWVNAGSLPELSSLFAAPEPPTTPPPTPVVPPRPAQGFAQGATQGAPQGAQQRPATTPPPVERPQSYLWLGICTTILCCLPAGVVSIVYAAMVDSAWNRGDYATAVKYSNMARTWGIVSAIVAAVVIGAYLILGVLGLML